MAITQPLDLERIFINNLAGTPIIFFFLAVILFAYVGARFRMPNMVFLILMGLFVVLFPIQFNFIYLLVVFVASFFFYTVLKKLMN